MPGKSDPPDPLRSRLLAAWNHGWCGAVPPADEAATLSALERAAGGQPERLAVLFGDGVHSGGTIHELLAAEDPWKAGDTLGGSYRISAWHEGGFARVALCRHLPSGCEVALKSPRRRHLQNPAAAESFAAEARRWMQLGSHPHLVQAHGLESIGGRLFLVLEAVPGGRTLSDELIGGAADWPLALRTGAQIAAALAHAEQRLGLIHGDLKPANILVAPGGIHKLTDFGISFARQVESADAERLSHTPGYVGPEFRAGGPRTTATDMYAFGVTLWQALTGRPATDAGTIWPEGTPLPLQRRLQQCLAPEPASRPGSFLLLARELAALHQEFLGKPVAFAPLPPGLAPFNPGPEAARHAANLALSLRDLGNWEVAEAAARRAISLTPDYAAGHDALGCCLLDTGRIAEALDAFTAACRHAPDDVPARLHLARAQHLSRRTEEARASVRTAIRAAETAANGPSQLGLDTALLVELLPKAEALPLLYRLTSAGPGQLSAWINLTLLLRMLDQTEAAVRSARGAVTAHPGDALAWAALSGALQDAGETADALAAADRAVALGPDLPEAHGQLIAVLWMAGERTEAAEKLADALRHWPQSSALAGLAAQLQAPDSPR
jgi:tetratricopeptide (TPR) repeat protein